MILRRLNALEERDLREQEAADYFAWEHAWEQENRHGGSWMGVPATQPPAAQVEQTEEAA